MTVQRLQLALTAAVLLAAGLLAAYLVYYTPSRSGSQVQAPQHEQRQSRITVAYALCLRPEAASALREAAASLGLSVVKANLLDVAGKGTIVVVDAERCPLREAAQAVAAVLLRGGVVVVVGTNREISRLFKAQQKVIMAYPLPVENSTVIYALQIVGNTVTEIMGRLVNMSKPQVFFAKGVTVESFKRVLDMAMRWLHVG